MTQLLATVPSDPACSHRAAVHQPDRHGSGVAVAPENVGLAVVVEVRRAGKHPVGGDGADR